MLLIVLKQKYYNLIIIVEVSLESTVPAIVLETESYNVTVANETDTQLNNFTLATSQELTTSTYQEIKNATDTDTEKKFTRSNFILRRLSDIYDKFDRIVNRIGIGGFIEVSLESTVPAIVLETESYNVTVSNETDTQLNNFTLATSQELTTSTYQEIKNVTDTDTEKKFTRSNFILRRLSDIYDKFDSIVNRIGIGGFIGKLYRYLHNNEFIVKF
ncbi:hypothetical protein FQR65_LT13454 [Abscondita terminalis]|nr:hypothetical protein FQR65_LT13454 [Abscondita terminalis]